VSRSLPPCDHLSDWSDPHFDCPLCCFLPERHRGFFRSQLNHLDLWDGVMREIKWHAPELKQHSYSFHLGDGGQYPSDRLASMYCPCVLEGRLREECRSGCECNKFNKGKGFESTTGEQSGLREGFGGRMGKKERDMKNNHNVREEPTEHHSNSNHPETIPEEAESESHT